ncbi:MAG: molybdopterin-dependent oxidoreductase, partial [Methyloprofundus sp.]|nr:molybdopterin-dependent oxidoreductase [Methyloprofundus sp.]
MITDAELHVRGLAHFVDDLQHPEGLLHAITFCSSVAHAEIINLDMSAALAIEGVKAIFSAKDIVGKNQIGGLVEDEPLFAEKHVFCVGESIALVVATTPEIARAARNAINCEYKEKDAVFDAREAYAKGLIHPPERSFVLGNVEKVWADCDLVIEGQANNGAQEHVYMETQSALAMPLEHGGVKLYAATQSPSMTQKMTAQVLGCAMHQVEVDVLRLGGAFGGKEEQATRWAVFAALAASQLKQPVKIVLNRDEDMTLTGKRHPYSSDFKMGLSKEGKILAYQVFYYQNAGATNDLSSAILDRSLFHISNSYFIPNVQATAVSCKTNLPSNTAFRGFGAPQAMFVIESAIYQAAQILGVDTSAIQAKNLIQENDVFPYGMAVKYCQAKKCWNEVQQRYQVSERQAEIADFNQQHPLHKKALALMPVCFAISFNATFLNQARALVHIYTDGSVGVSTSAVEMGQGVKAKIRQIAATVLGIDVSKVKLESTNTTR